MASFEGFCGQGASVQFGAENPPPSRKPPPLLRNPEIWSDLRILGYFEGFGASGRLRRPDLLYFSTFCTDFLGEVPSKILKIFRLRRIFPTLNGLGGISEEFRGLNRAAGARKNEVFGISRGNLGLTAPQAREKKRSFRDF